MRPVYQISLVKFMQLLKVLYLIHWNVKFFPIILLDTNQKLL